MKRKVPPCLTEKAEPGLPGYANGEDDIGFSCGIRAITFGSLCVPSKTARITEEECVLKRRMIRRMLNFCTEMRTDTVALSKAASPGSKQQQIAQKAASIWIAREKELHSEFKEWEQQHPSWPSSHVLSLLPFSQRILWAPPDEKESVADDDEPLMPGEEEPHQATQCAPLTSAEKPVIALSLQRPQLSAKRNHK